MVAETNRYAADFMAENPEKAGNSFVGRWKPIDNAEMKSFLPLTILSDIVKKPNL